MDDPGQTGWSERTDADLSSLLSELSRVYKAAAFYGPDDPATTTFAERACRAWQSDLARAGPLELEVTEMGFRLHDAPGLFANAPLGEIAGGQSRVEFIGRESGMHGLHERSDASDVGCGHRRATQCAIADQQGVWIRIIGQRAYHTVANAIAIEIGGVEAAGCRDVDGGTEVGVGC